MAEKHFVPKTPNHFLYLIKLFTCSSYPAGNFGKNQLLSASISLSPLCTAESIDLHVRTPTNFHPNFSRLRSRQAKINAFRVVTTELVLCVFRHRLLTRTNLHKGRSQCLVWYFFQYGLWFSTKTLALLLHSLDRVSRRDVKLNFYWFD